MLSVNTLLRQLVPQPQLFAPGEFPPEIPKSTDSTPRREETRDPNMEILLKVMDYYMLVGTLDHKIEAYEIMDAWSSQEQEYELQWRMAKACCLISNIFDKRGLETMKRQYLSLGYVHAYRAWELEKYKPEGHIMFIALMLNDPLHGSFQYFRKLILHLSMALNLSPNDATLHALIAKYKWQLATRSIPLQEAANWLPRVSFQDILNSYIHSDYLEITPIKETRLQIARCYFKLKQWRNSLKWLQLASQLPVRSEEDKLTQREIFVIERRAKEFRKFIQKNPSCLRNPLALQEFKS